MPPVLVSPAMPALPSPLRSPVTIWARVPGMFAQVERLVEKKIWPALVSPAMSALPSPLRSPVAIWARVPGNVFQETRLVV